MAKQAQRKKFEGAKFVTPVFRASFLNVFEPKAYEDAAPTYSVEMLFNKKGADLTEMKAAIHKLCVKAWGKDKAKWPKNFRSPFKDGDDPDRFGDDVPQERRDIYAGHVFARASSGEDYPPGIYGKDPKNDMETPTKRDLYSGCYCKASLYMVPYENIGGKGPDGKSGVKLYLSGIQLVKKGEALGGAGSSADDFEVIESEEGEETSSDEDDDYDI